MNTLLLGLALAHPPHLPPVPYPPAPLPAPVVVAGYSPDAPISPQDFARTFRPTPGVHQVWFLHPRTKCPVFVSFTLPDGCPKVKSGKRHVEFDYGKKEVEVCFKLNGKVEVEY